MLHVATLNGNKQLVETILDMGADINDQVIYQFVTHLLIRSF